MRRLIVLIACAAGGICFVPDQASAQTFLRYNGRNGKTSIVLKHPALSGDGYRGNTATPNRSGGGPIFLGAYLPMPSPQAGQPVPRVYVVPKRGLRYRAR